MARIEDYALIGDCHSAALVCLDGSIDWLCLPRFDSAACFAALLGSRQNGRWRIAPAGIVSRTTRQYLGDSLVLETVFETADGAVALIDFMTIEPSNVLRIIEGRRGTVPCQFELILRFDYGISIPWVTRLRTGYGIRAVAGPDQVIVRADVPLQARDMTTVADFAVNQGERIRFSLTHAPSHLPLPDAPDPDNALTEAETHWNEWSDRSTYSGRWQAPVRRSLLTLKALTYLPTGGITAAVTTSLPEALGGMRNWDYRFCWPRDSSFTLLSLTDTGHRDEARASGDWLRRAIAGAPEQLQALYGLAGERFIPEREIHWLAGYEASQPVRIGNAAMEQHQLDVFGEMELAFRREIDLGFVAPRAHWTLRRTLIEHLIAIWRQPDEGIWEVRGGPQQFTYSKAMAWAAMDCAIRSAEEHGLPAPLDQWRKVRDEIFDLVCERGYNVSVGAFTQTLDGTNLDASLLLLPLIGFLPPSDPRIVSTVDAIGRELMADGLIRRYHTHETEDGLPPGEATFLACSFWYASNLSLQDRQDEAVALFERLLGLCNDVGLLAEEYDHETGRQLGNFPQAFSHLALIGTALVLDGTVRTL
ncbi:MAG: glycoside hydrolase family 15 protein [Acetobacteraceae bacterium]